MRVLIATVLLCVISVVSINAAVSIALAQVNPDHPGKCWHSNTNTAYTVGTHHPNDTCSEINCSPSFSLSFYTCGVVLAPEGHHNEIDLTKPYPKCCLNIVKDTEKNEAEAAPSP